MGDRDRYKPDRPVFCGNFEYDARQSEIERLFERFGKIDRVDMKTGFAFVYMMDTRDGDDAIRALHRTEFGFQKRRLMVEWARGDGSVKQREDLRRRQTKPTTTLFVVNFEPVNTRVRDLERHFGPFGPLVRTQIKKNFAFVQYETVADATRAKEECHQRPMAGRVLTVEYVAHGDSSARSSSRGRSRSPVGRRGRSSISPPPRRRSPPPRRRSSDRRDRSRDHDRRRSPELRRSPRYDSPGRGLSPAPRRLSPSPRRVTPPPRGEKRSRSPVPKRSVSPGAPRDASRSRSPIKKEVSMSPERRSLSPR